MVRDKVSTKARSLVDTNRNRTLIDTHCHIDLYKTPGEVAKRAESSGIPTVAVTYLPSHFDMAELHLQNFKFVRPALGLHPQSVKDHADEIDAFCQLASRVDLIGEIGLDFSVHLRANRTIQEESLERILSELRGRQRFITLHSRNAEDAVLKHLLQAGISRCVFHWFSGSKAQLVRILDAGHLISINTAMIETLKWAEFIKTVPKDRVLTESDGPFAKCEGKLAEPAHMVHVLDWLSTQWNESRNECAARIRDTFDSILSGVFPSI